MPQKLRCKIAKSDLALKLEEKLGISWDLSQQFPFDAGYDVRATIEEPINLWPKHQMIVGTGLYFELESPYWEIQVRPRSGIAAKHGITIVNSPGTVDYGYRDEVKIILANLSNTPFAVSPGDRIAQICFKEIPQVLFDYVPQVAEHIVYPEDYEWVREEKRAARKRGGLGSTGVQ